MAVHLVTGGCGYLGGFLVRELVKRGNEVRILDVIDENSISKLGRFYRTDILNSEEVYRAMQGVDYVHHSAALVPVKKAGQKFWDINVKGTETVFQAAQKAGVKHFSHISSSAVFGNVTETDCPIANNPSHLTPVEPYGRSKAAAEKIILTHASGKMTYSILRPRTIIGPERLGIFEILYKWVSQGKHIYIIGNGKNLFQFVHVDDIVDVSIETAERQIQGIFNIGTDRFETLEESLLKFLKEVGSHSKIRKIPFPLAAFTLYVADKAGISPLSPWHYLTYHKPYHFDLEPAFSRLNWRPRYSNSQMLTESYSWYLENRTRLPEKTSAHRGILNHGILKILESVS
jgi:nucleoside-diphosphate-sugar epimerase